MAWEAISPPPFLLVASSSFYTSFSPLSYVHVQVSLFRADICLVNPYPKWLGVVVKAEEHGPVKHKVLNCNIGSLSLEPLLNCTRSFFCEHSGGCL